MTQPKKKIHNIIIDADGKADGLTDVQAKTMESSYHFIEGLCVSAHALSIFGEFMVHLSNKQKDELSRICKKIMNEVADKNPTTVFLAMEVLYVNAYSRLFDSGLVNVFNQIKMEREGIMQQIYHKNMMEDAKQTTTEKPQEKTPEKNVHSHVNAEVA
ncbi:MAG: hypothetical protein KAS32_13730 [Candidatus Peribacteraceae bacterium]|nr:hypothetical protein [Candidatus Peribacteraceae bacterium]